MKEVSHDQKYSISNVQSPKKSGMSDERSKNGKGLDDKSDGTLLSAHSHLIPATNTVHVTNSSSISSSPPSSVGAPDCSPIDAIEAT